MDAFFGSVENRWSVVHEPFSLWHLTSMSEQFLAAVRSTVSEAGSPPARIADERGSAHQVLATDGSTIRQLLPYYLAYVEHEWRLAGKTRDSYGEGIHSALQILGDIKPQELDHHKVVMLKSAMAARGAGPSRGTGSDQLAAKFSPLLPAKPGPGGI